MATGLYAAGGIKGFISNTAGEPLEFATIYIDELGSGTVTNIEGYYEFRMLPGDSEISTTRRSESDSITNRLMK